MKYTEEQLKLYAKPLSETEEARCKNVINMVVDALKTIGFEEKVEVRRLYEETPFYEARMEFLSEGYDINIFLQGSYANNTNVRGNSDVDIVVAQEDRFSTIYREGVTDANYHFKQATPRAKNFKDVVEEALRKKFGNDVERRNKSIKIYGNSYRKDADSVPAMRHRDYSLDYSNNPDNYQGGILISADDGKLVINYPEQHIKKGIEKNKATNLYFKKMVRIAKELRYQMVDCRYEHARQASSFGVECLVWNVPNELFLGIDSYRLIFDQIVSYLYINKLNILNFKEVNGIKGLCDDDYKRAEIYQGYIQELREFYEYDI